MDRTALTRWRQARHRNVHAPRRRHGAGLVAAAAAALVLAATASTAAASPAAAHQVPPQPPPSDTARPAEQQRADSATPAARQRADTSAPAPVARRSASQASARPQPIPRESVPFGVGERAQYRVSYNLVGRVGTGSMQIVGVDTVRGHPAFHAVFTLQGRFLFARVDNRFESWLDVDRVFSHRFEQNTHEVNFRRRRTREFLPAELRWTGHTNDREETGTLATAEPLDDTSFLYYVRLMDLEVGDEHSLERYWNEEGNPVTIRVLREQQVRVPAGTFNTVVLQPIIRTSGMFSEGGEAEVYFNREWPHQLVMLRAKVSFGTLQLQLEEFTAASALLPPDR